MVVWWGKACQSAVFLVSNLTLVGEISHWYRRRMCIETFFSDQKSRGFRLDKSHLRDPARLFRLLMAACLAYIWLIYLGVHAAQHGYLPLLHRTDRCDLSLFQLGLDLLDHFLNAELLIQVDFRLPPEFLFTESVRYTLPLVIGTCQAQRISLLGGFHVAIPFCPATECARSVPARDKNAAYRDRFTQHNAMKPPPEQCWTAPNTQLRLNFGGAMQHENALGQRKRHVDSRRPPD